MIHTWLGMRWDEVKTEIDGMDKPYTLQITRPYGKMESWGSCRVVRVREYDDRMQFVLAHEKYSTKNSLTP